MYFVFVPHGQEVHLIIDNTLKYPVKYFMFCLEAMPTSLPCNTHISKCFSLLYCTITAFIPQCNVLVYPMCVFYRVRKNFK